MGAIEVLTVGRVGVDLYAEQKGASLAEARTFAKSVGGSPTNVAVAAARLGCSSAVVTAVGEDDFGIVKLGGDGVLVATGEGRTRVEPFPVEVVCGLGAGDAFGGALCRGLLAGATPVEAVRAANAAGAIVASRLLCADAMPTADEVDELLDAAGARA